MSVRSLSWLWILGASIGAVGIWYATRAPVTVANAVEPAKAVVHTDTQTVAAPAAIPTTPAADSTTVEGWIVDATAGDAARRAAAL
ncbi:MAG: hypothetical protein H7Y89_05725, partial [Steroidobacteraceae bacterium]|nr:hypothetical protein [Steroidobacteraceae bacterium]